MLRENKKEINLNNIISNVSLGFWVDFFNLKYKNTFGSNLMKIFNCYIEPNILYRKLVKVKNKLRNRITHRENMIKYNIMKEYYSLII